MSKFNESINPVPHGEGDPNWKRHFDEASEMPPPRVWDAIERDLDQQDDDRVIVVPFWGRSSTWAWSAAAAVVLLLLGWWNGRDDVSGTKNMALGQTNSRNVVRGKTSEHQKASAPNQTEQPISGYPESLTHFKPTDNQLTTSTPQQENRLLPDKSLIRQTDQQQVRSAQLKQKSVLADESPMVSSNQNDSDKRNQTKRALSVDPIAGLPTRQPELANVSKSANPAITQPAPTGQVPNIPLLMSAPKNTPANIALTTLTSRPMQLPTLYGTQRIVWFAPTETSTTPTEVNSEKPKTERWASVSVMPSSFNPGVRLQQATATYGNAFAQSSKSYSVNPTLNSQANLSIAYQLSGGMQLSNRWSVETGVGYLEGRSSVSSPVQTIVAAMALSGNGRLSNLYADALNNSRVADTQGRYTSSSPSADKTANALTNINVYDVGRSQQLSNNYMFMQIPVQLGYQMRPHKRLGFTVLGGLLTNLFIKNTVNDQFSVTNSDKVYRPVTLSASTGIRFRYRPTRRWSASMAGIFQQALQRGTRPGTDLTTRPQTMGVNIGLDYHF